GLSARLDEVLHLHLFELAGPENEVPRSDLIPEGLTDLCDPKRKLPSHSSLDVREVHKNPLSCFRTEVDHGGSVFDRAHLRLELQVEVPRFRERVLRLTVRTRGREIDVVRAEAALAGLTVHHRIGEVINVA